jgi:hypothetical protein
MDVAAWCELSLLASVDTLLEAEVVELSLCNEEK